jgi:hypothetical protein
MTREDQSTSVEDKQRRQTMRAMAQAGLALPEVWLYYFSITGSVDEYEIDAYLNQMIVLPAIECDKLAHAINELIGQRPPVTRAPYRDDLSP